MAYELIIIGGGIVFGLIGFIIGALLVHRAYKASPSLMHYKKIIDILTLRKLHNKLYSGDLVYDKTKSKTGEDHIGHYESMRDMLTIRKKTLEEPLTEGLGFGGIGLGNIIGGFIAILIGVSLLPAIAEQVGQAQNQMNITSPSIEITTTMLKLVPVFFAIAILGIGIAVAFSTLRNIGMV